MGSNSSTMASPIIVPAPFRHTATVIWLHGLGDTGKGWASSLQELMIPHVKYICPTAPVMPVTLNAGFQMPSWFDLNLDPSGPEDEDGIKHATEIVHNLISKEMKRGIPANRIMVGGFSQGGALAIYSALRFSNNLGGIFGSSCWLPLHSHFPQAALSNLDTPLLQFHGDADCVVPYQWGLVTSKILNKFMKRARFNSYPGVTHTINEQGLLDIRSFIEQCLPPV